MTDAAIAPDAAIALGLACTAMPFARTAEAQAERWLRILRLSGDAGAALQAIGVSEGRLDESAAERDASPSSSPPASVATAPGLARQSPSERSDTDAWAGDAAADPVGRVSEQAVAVAARRGCAGVGTTDLLLAVMCVYGEDFDRVLRAHGSDRQELLQRLGVTLSPEQICG